MDDGRIKDVSGITVDFWTGECVKDLAKVVDKMDAERVDWDYDGIPHKDQIREQDADSLHLEGFEVLAQDENGCVLTTCGELFDPVDIEEIEFLQRKKAEKYSEEQYHEMMLAIWKEKKQ